MWKFKQKTWLQIFIIYTRYLIGGAFVFASIIKIQGHRFTSNSGELEPINSAWHFFETLYASGTYWKFIGIGQLLAGLLLMTQRYAKLGALLYLPIITNIFFITISYYFAYTPVVTGLMLCANIMLLIWDWNELKILFNLPYEIDNSPRLEKNSIWQIIGLLLFSFTLFFRLTSLKVEPWLWFLTCAITGVAGLILGLQHWKKQKNSFSESYEI